MFVSAEPVRVPEELWTSRAPLLFISDRALHPLFHDSLDRGLVSVGLNPLLVAYSFYRWFCFDDIFC